MAKEDPIDVEGVVVNVLPNAQFEVEISGGHRRENYLALQLTLAGRGPI